LETVDVSLHMLLATKVPKTSVQILQ